MNEPTIILFDGVCNLCAGVVKFVIVIRSGIFVSQHYKARLLRRRVLEWAQCSLHPPRSTR